MTRPKNADSEETWQKIVDAALEVMANDENDGIDVSLRDVATRAGVSLGTIHYYFATREALFEACLDGHYAGLDALVQELGGEVARSEPKPNRALLESCLRRIHRFALQQRPRLRLRAATNAARGFLHPERQMRVRGPYLDGFAALLEPRVDVDRESVRKVIQSMTYLVTQYVLLTDPELEQIVGARGDEGRQRVEDHLAEVTLRLLFK